MARLLQKYLMYITCLYLLTTQLTTPKSIETNAEKAKRFGFSLYKVHYEIDYSKPLVSVTMVSWNRGSYLV
jgi:hypothetical protein